MNKLIVSLFLAICPVSLLAQKGNKQVVDTTGLTCIRQYMNQYPQSDLRDVYKYCFQDVFGVEHLLSDSLGAVKYIDFEMNNSDSNDWNRPLFYYPVGLQGNYIRVDINYVRSGIIPKEVFISAVLESARPVNGKERYPKPDIEQWRTQWSHICDLLMMVSPRPGNWFDDMKSIDRTLDVGKYALHHSQRFNDTYRQHYRIVRRDVFQQRLLPFIKNSEK